MSKSNNDLLIELKTKMEYVAKDIREIKDYQTTSDTRYATKTDVTALTTSINSLTVKLDDDYVTKEQLAQRLKVLDFIATNLWKIVFIILTTVIGALLVLVINAPRP